MGPILPEAATRPPSAGHMLSVTFRRGSLGALAEHLVGRGVHGLFALA
jgi:hypothetical protein